MTDPKITIDDLITGLVERERWKGAHPYLRNYFQLKADLLCDLFQCDLDRRAEELDDENGRNWAAFRRRSRPDDGEIDLTVYEVCGRGTISLLISCIDLINQTITPWSNSMEGMPPRIERDLRKAYDPGIQSKVEELMELYRRIISDVLEYLFPSIGLKAFPAGALSAMGLPREPPDPDDYF